MPFNIAAVVQVAIKDKIFVLSIRFGKFASFTNPANRDEFLKEVNTKQFRGFFENLNS